MARRLGRKVITRKRAPIVETDTHDQVADWTGALDEAVIRGCSVQPGIAGPTYVTDREAATVLWTVLAPPRSDVVDTDRIAYAGDDYDIDSIERWLVGSTHRDHLVIRLKKVNG